MKIKRLINFVVPVTACNFQCHYCYVGQEGHNTGELGQLQYSPEHIQQCMTVQRWGGVCHINICGLGETLIPEYVLDLTKRMLENGHYVSIVTNGILTKRLQMLCSLPQEYQQRLFVKFSFHYLELLRQGLLEEFFHNVHLVRNSGCAFSIELTVNDETIPHITDIQRICRRELGADCHVIESRNNLDGFSRLTKLPESEHQRAWSTFHSELFDFQQTLWMEKRKEFCYAGEWVCSLNVGSGWLMPCFSGGNAIQNVFEDPEEPIRFVAIGENCPWTHCYAAYILMTSGAIPQIKSPTYAQLRDRICEDDSHWLTSSVHEFFSSKFSESNSEYSKGKKQYINALMGLEYGNDCPCTYKELAVILTSALSARKIKTVAIWGKQKYTELLFSIFSNGGLKLKYVVDADFYTEEHYSLKSKLKHRYKYLLKAALRKSNSILWLNRYDRLPNVDAMIILDYAHFGEVSKQIPPIYKELLSITELAD